MAYKAKYDYLASEKELKAEIAKHKSKGSITEETIDKPVMLLNFLRAENELKHAEAIFKVSESSKLKQDLSLLETDTFYSGAIAHAYYAIFFAAKALLLREGISTRSPNIHKATLDAFAYYFITTGRLDVELLRIYSAAIVKADSLLGLFVSEQDKRGTFTYKRLPDANREPAKESIASAVAFLTQIKKVIGRS